MEHSTTIKSAHDGMTLEFFDRGGDRFKVGIRGSHVSGTASISSFEPVKSRLADFFRDLAVHWEGWKGKREWASLEGDLALSATSDSTGHISLQVRLRSGPYPFDWSLSVTLLIEAGQLERIASDMERFFGHECAA